MSKFLLAAAAVLAVSIDATNYGSYVTQCSETAVTFLNFKEQDCQGNHTDFSKPLDQCKKEFIFFSWNAGCNATNMWYNNFKDGDCGGKSVLTRTYNVGTCFNCPNKKCKNP